MAQICESTGGYSMGLAYGLDDPCAEPLRAFRWLLRLEGVVASDDIENGVYTLPHKTSEMPHLTFKEAEFPHLTETIHYPMRPEWTPIKLVLYSIKRKNNNRCNPVMEWIKFASPNPSDPSGGLFDPENAIWRPIVSSRIKRDASLLLLDGCGFIQEKWFFENAYPTDINWGELDMASSDVLTISITLRYDRAWQVCDFIPGTIVQIAGL